MEPAGRVLIVGAQIASGPEARLVVNTGAGTSALGRIEGLLGLDFLRALSGPIADACAGRGAPDCFAVSEFSPAHDLPGKPRAVFEQAADVGDLADVLGAVVDDADQAHANGHGRIPAGVDHAVHRLARDAFEVLERAPVDGRVVVHTPSSVRKYTG